ncbi:hypothetical protein [Pelagibacterium halotolerans]|uniref:hypothetical protein n=1 Tax=Pelagibacterium halotolerans TaxID=531813 RepID=UPI00384D8A9F
MTMHDENPNLPEDVPAIERPSGPIEEAGILGKWTDKAGIVFAACFLVSMVVLIFEIIMRAYPQCADALGTRNHDLSVRHRLYIRRRLLRRS